MAKYENVEDELNAIMSGDYEKPEVAEEESNTNDEDTDHTEEEEDVTETNDEAAEQVQDTDESESDEDEENTLVDEDSSEEEDPDEVIPEEVDTKEDGEEAEDVTETEDEADGADSENTDDIDYKKQYEELMKSTEDYTKFKDFHEQVAGVKFKANGKEVEGFSDPKKLIQAQQMAYNYSEKMSGFKPYRKFMGPLKDRGILEDSTKFDLAMSLIDGDKEALKQHIKNLGVDPLDLDMDTIEYAAESKSSSRGAIAIEDALATAKSYGVEDRVYNTVMKEWDDASFQEFVGSPAVQEDLITQMANGDYDIVMNKVNQLGVLDSKFSEMKMVDQYRLAVKDLVAENTKRVAVDQEVVNVETTKKEAEQVAKDVKYKKEVAKKNKEATSARKKATVVSKKRPVTSNKRKKVDPMSFDGQGIENFLDKMIMGKN